MITKIKEEEGKWVNKNEPQNDIKENMEKNNNNGK